MAVHSLSGGLSAFPAAHRRQHRRAFSPGWDAQTRGRLWAPDRGEVRGQRWREIVVGLRGPGAARRVSRLQSESRAGIVGPPERHTGWSPQAGAGWAGVSAEDERPPTLAREEPRSGSSARLLLSGAPDRRGKPTCAESPAHWSGVAELELETVSSGLWSSAGAVDGGCGGPKVVQAAAPPPTGAARRQARNPDNPRRTFPRRNEAFNGASLICPVIMQWVRSHDY